MADRPPVVALIGPTGSGKSAIALSAAEATGAAIVAIDAFTVYRQMSIGTAKPTVADRARVPHRMIDLLDVEEDCAVRWFQTRAREAVEQVRSTDRPVLLVGGSGLYFRAVVDPLEFPPTDGEVRAGIERRVAADPAAAHARLVDEDPDAAARIDPANTRRITRAFEVAELTGRPFSSFRTAWDTHDSVYAGLRVVGLDLAPADLAARIDRRVDAMLAAGWVEECRALLDRDLSTTAAQAIGYAELLDHLRAGGGQPSDTVIESIATRTRRFAARQRRWFRRDPRVEWTTTGPAADAVTAALRGRDDWHATNGLG